MSLTAFQTRVVAKQIAEIRRVIDVANSRGLGNRCSVFQKVADVPEPTVAAILKRTDIYLNTWVEIPLLKIEQVLTTNEKDGGTFSKEDLLRA